MSKRNIFIVVCVFFLCLAFSGCSNYADIPPNDIGMILTPTGYENKVQTPGQVDLGTEDTATNRGNKLVLLQRSGIQIKEAFIGSAGNSDKEDHRCLVQDKSPLTLDIRLLLALPNYETPQGQKDLARIFLLGNPTPLKDAVPVGRVMRINAESIYNEQAQQQVRGKIRQVVMSYKDFDEILVAFGDVGEDGLGRRIEKAISSALVDQQITLRLISATVSNIKPDPAVVEANVAKKAAEKRIDALRVLTNFLDEDQTGTRRLVYKMQVWQEIVSTANNNGHNTIFMTDIVGDSHKIIPIP